MINNKINYFQTILSFIQPFTDFLFQVTSSKAQTDHRSREAQRNSVPLEAPHRDNG